MQWGQQHHVSKLALHHYYDNAVVCELGLSPSQTGPLCDIEDEWQQFSHKTVIAMLLSQPQFEVSDSASYSHTHTVPDFALLHGFFKS